MKKYIYPKTISVLLSLILLFPLALNAQKSEDTACSYLNTIQTRLENHFHSSKDSVQKDISLNVQKLSENHNSQIARFTEQRKKADAHRQNLIDRLLARVNDVDKKLALEDFSRDVNELVLVRNFEIDKALEDYFQKSNEANQLLQSRYDSLFTSLDEQIEIIFNDANQLCLSGAEQKEVLNNLQSSFQIIENQAELQKVNNEAIKTVTGYASQRDTRITKAKESYESGFDNLSKQIKEVLMQ